MRIKLAIPDHLVTPEALEAALEATMLANEQAMLRGEIPDVRDAISKGVKWKPEPYTDGEHFDLGHEVMRRQWGDCDDLAPWLGASLRASGEDEGARPRVYQSGPDRWHVVTETSDGEILDPSKWAGMGKRSSPTSPGVSGAIATPFAHPLQGALCVAPHGGLWRARADVPFADCDAHLASHGYGSTPERALDRAVSGAMCCGEQVDSPALERLREAGTLLLTQAGDASEAMREILRGPVVGVTETEERVRSMTGLHILRGWLKRKKPEMLAELDRKSRFPNERVAKMWDEMGPDQRRMFRRFRPDREDRLGNFVRKTGGKLLKMAATTAANTFVPGSGTILSELTSPSGSGPRTVPAGAMPAGKGVSVSIPSHHGSRHESTHHESAHPMTLYYHPAGAIGPVVMRF